MGRASRTIPQLEPSPAPYPSSPSSLLQLQLEALDEDVEDDNIQG